MSMRYPGGLIATSPVNARYPSGVWTQAQAAPYQAQNVWTRDQFWPYTTLLLQGDGAVNGAQNNTFLDSSSNNFTITRNGNTTQGAFTPYEQDGYWSNYFDGSGDYLTTPSNTAFAFGTGDFTVEAFVFITATNSQNLRVFTTAGVGSDFAFEINTSLQLAHFNGSTTLTLGGSVPLNQWVHIAWVRSGSTVTGYINGVSIGTATSSANMSNSQTISIGATANYTSGQTAYISNLRVVKGTAVYTSAFTPSTAPLTAITNTSLLTCQSNRFKDNSTNNFTLTVNGNTSVQAFQPFPGATTYSGTVLGGSGYFDGSGDFLVLPTSQTPLLLGNSDFTAEAWVYRQSGTGTATVFCGQSDLNTVAGSSYVFYVSASAGSDLYSGGSGFGITSPNPPVGAWAHVAWVRTGGTYSSYLNGVRVGTRSDLGTSSVNNGSTASAPAIGAFANGGNALNGYISNLRLIKGSGGYDATQSTITIPTAPLTAVTNTSLLTNFTNAGIYDNSMMNNLETVGNAQVSTSVVKYGTGSMAFDGTSNCRVQVSSNVAPVSLNMGTGDYTVELWMYAGTPGSQQTIFDFRNADVSGQGVALVYTTSRTLVVYMLANRITSSPIAANTWTHVAVVRANGIYTLYVNGLSAGTWANSDAVVPPANRPYIGAVNDGSQTFNGYIDDFRITKGVARYITNFTPPPARMPGQ